MHFHTICFLFFLLHWEAARCPGVPTAPGWEHNNKHTRTRIYLWHTVCGDTAASRNAWSGGGTCPSDSRTGPQDPDTTRSPTTPSWKLQSSIPGRSTQMRCRSLCFDWPMPRGKQPSFAHSKHGHHGPAVPWAGPGLTLCRREHPAPPQEPPSPLPWGSHSAGAPLQCTCSGGSSPNRGQGSCGNTPGLDPHPTPLRPRLLALQAPRTQPRPSLSPTGWAESTGPTAAQG